MTRWVARWSETRAAPGKAPAAGSWVPQPWEQARTVLADQLRRNLDRWAASVKTRAEYQALIDLLDQAAEPSGRALIFELRDHIVSLTRSEAS